GERVVLKGTPQCDPKVFEEPPHIKELGSKRSLHVQQSEATGKQCCAGAPLIRGFRMSGDLAVLEAVEHQARYERDSGEVVIQSEDARAMFKRNGCDQGVNGGGQRDAFST